MFTIILEGWGCGIKKGLGREDGWLWGARSLKNGACVYVMCVGGGGEFDTLTHFPLSNPGRRVGGLPVV